MIRVLSHTEIQTGLTCELKWDYRYGGHIAGSALRPKTTAPALRDGRAWGRGAATWHAEVLRTDALALAHNAIDESLKADAEAQEAAGVFFPDTFDEITQRLHRMLDHYTATAEPLPLDRLEHELVVSIPSRTGRRRSSRYRLQCFFDGVHIDDDGRTWIVEIKLRGQLQPFELIARSRQLRWYAFAYRELHGVEPAGAIVDERWNEAPKAARLVQGRKKDQGKVPSHAADQLTTPELYLALCAEHGVEPKAETLEAMGARRWQARHPIIFRAGELDEAGDQLVSAGELIRDLDSGARYPIRNPSQPNCNGCSFRQICPDLDDELVDALFERTPPKKDRDPKESREPVAA